MSFPCPSIILITGIMASGKSTIAQRVAERLSSSVHLCGDVFRRMMVNNRAAISSPLSAAAMAQLRLRYRLAASVAEMYCEGGFTVVYQDVIIGPMLGEVVAMLGNWPLHIVVLCPSPDVAAQRDAARDKRGYVGWTPHMLNSELRANTPRLGLWLDNSSLTIDETVDAIFANADKTRVGV
ncbi:MAG: AAA family ATPase [Chloroflexi bacterium]|nr:AAA family ATPase [Chloroflexota bacterium]